MSLLPGLPKIDIETTVESFKLALEDIQVATETAANAAVAALIAEHGVEQAARLLDGAARLRKEMEG